MPKISTGTVEIYDYIVVGALFRSTRRMHRQCCSTTFRPSTTSAS
jgi:hypothetical protein